MPHKEIIEYKGQKIEVITLDTEVHLNQPVPKILKEIEHLIDEDEKYQKNGRLSNETTNEAT